jgi:hypothetical protein
MTTKTQDLRCAAYGKRIRDHHPHIGEPADIPQILRSPGDRVVTQEPMVRRVGMSAYLWT